MSLTRRALEAHLNRIALHRGDGVASTHDEKEVQAWGALTFAADRSEPPTGGWLRAIRYASGKLYRKAAAKSGRTISAIQHLERAEYDGDIKLGAMRKYAEQMGFKVIVTVRPIEPKLAAFLAERKASELELRKVGEKLRKDGELLTLVDELLSVREQQRLSQRNLGLCDQGLSFLKELENDFAVRPDKEAVLEEMKALNHGLEMLLAGS